MSAELFLHSVNPRSSLSKLSSLAKWHSSHWATSEHNSSKKTRYTSSTHMRIPFIHVEIRLCRLPEQNEYSWCRVVVNPGWVFCHKNSHVPYLSRKTSTSCFSIISHFTRFFFSSARTKKCKTFQRHENEALSLLYKIFNWTSQSLVISFSFL